MNIPGLSISDQQILDAVLKEKGYVLPTPGGSSVDQAIRASSLPKGFSYEAPNPNSYQVKTDNYRIDPRGSRMGDAMLGGAELLGSAYGQYSNAVDPLVDRAQNAITGKIGQMGGATKVGSAIGRMAGSNAARLALKSLPAVGSIGGVLAAGDILLGEETVANKGMDAAFGLGAAIKGAAAGAAAGSVVPGLGTLGGAIAGGLAGFGLGKTASDATQFVGGKVLGIESEEERKMREALAMLNGGRI
tara:strand:- start:48 stop:785 length:738 start_codon:yes stop_codon:yes gene_type:complete